MNALQQNTLQRLDPDVVPLCYRLDLTIDPKKKTFFGEAQIDLVLRSATDTLVLHAQNISFKTIVARSKTGVWSLAVDSIQNDGTVAIKLPHAMRDNLTLGMTYSAPLSTGLEGIYKLVDGKRSSVFTQFEAIGARRAFPCFDEPGFKAKFEITLRVPAKLKAVSNGLEIKRQKFSKNFIAHYFAPTPPLPTYLIAFAVGDFDIVNAKPIAKSKLRKISIPLRGIAMRGRGKDLKYALSITAKLLLAQEAYFGIAYPFDKLDIIAVPDLGAGGMENAGAITYDESYVFVGQHPPLARRRDFLSIHAHEISHHWFGNLVTPRWWDDLWLNESFACLMEVKFASLIEPDWHYEMDLLSNANEAMVLDSAPSVRRVHEKVDTIGGISAAFDAITYQKGSVILAMVEAELGATLFRNLIRKFLRAHAFKNITTHDFFTALRREKNGDAASRILLSYIENAGLPKLQLDQRDSNRSISQSRYLNESGKADWVVPLPHTWPNASKVSILPVDDVPRYFAFDVDDPVWTIILAKLPKFSRQKGLAVAMSFDLMFFEGRLSLAQYLAGVVQIAKHSDWEVAGYPIDRLAFLATEMSDDKTVMDLLRNIFHAAFAPRLKRIGLARQLAGGTLNSWILEMQREPIVNFMTATKSDEHAQVRLAKLGWSLLKGKLTSFDGNKIAPTDMASAALDAAAAQGGATFLRLVLAKLSKASDGYDREFWLGAIAASPAKQAPARIERLLLSQSLRNQEIPTLLSARAAFPEYRDEVWDIIVRNAKALLARLDGDLDVALIQTADVFVTEAQAGVVEKTITPLLGQLRGGAIQLSQTLGRIRLNAAFLKRLRGAI